MLNGGGMGIWDHYLKISEAGHSLALSSFICDSLRSVCAKLTSLMLAIRLLVD